MIRPSAILLTLLACGICRAADAPDGWRPFAVRDEIAPKASVEPADSAGGSYLLALAGRGDASVDGRWQRTVPVSAGKFYDFRADYRAERVATPARSVLARVVWLDAAGKQVNQPEFPMTSPATAPAKADGWRVLTGTYQAPAKAAAARLELHLRWAADGRVVFRNARLAETAAPTPRKVRLAAVNHRPAKSPGPQANLEALGRLVAKAADE